jgi:hypothetical protein
LIRTNQDCGQGVSSDRGSSVNRHGDELSRRQCDTRQQSVSHCPHDRGREIRLGRVDKSEKYHGVLEQEERQTGSGSSFKRTANPTPCPEPSARVRTAGQNGDRHPVSKVPVPKSFARCSLPETILISLLARSPSLLTIRSSPVGRPRTESSFEACRQRRTGLSGSARGKQHARDGRRGGQQRH